MSNMFIFNPAEVRTWAGRVLNNFNGGDSNTAIGCSKEFGQQLEKLVQPNVWTGDAAKKNYQDFIETNNMMVALINDFGRKFEESLNQAARLVSDMEVANLGADTTVVASYGGLSYEQLSELSQSSFNTDVVRYNYTAISEIHDALTSILRRLDDTVFKNTVDRLNEIGHGTGDIWEGTAAQTANQSLVAFLNKYKEEIDAQFSRCINNINQALQNAQQLDNNM